jgi:RND family efflux transporter MFP subunit
MTRTFALASLAALTSLAACGGEPVQEAAAVASADPGMSFVARDTMLPELFEASAVTEPFRQAALSTRLMGRVTAVHVREGERVAAGAVLVQLDDRDLAAKREQVDATLRSAEAAHREAALQAGRIRALFADSAAPRAQLDAVEAGLERAEQGVRAARAGAAEVEAIAEYASIRAPFAGLVTQRFVDAGAFAAPGSPLIRLEDATRLRVIASVAASQAARMRSGTSLTVTIEGIGTRGVVEGVVPAPGAALVNVQLLVDNRDARFSSGSAATVSIPGAMRPMLVVPSSAILRSGDLTGVRVRTPDGVTTRWVRLGRTVGDLVEVLSGLAAGEAIVVTDDQPAGA